MRVVCGSGWGCGCGGSDMNIVTVFIKTVVMMTTEKNYFPDDGCELYFVLGMWNESFCVR